MSLISRLYSYVNGQASNASHVSAEFDQLIDQSNNHEARLEKIKLDELDTQAEYLLTKLLSGANISFTEIEEEGVRKIRISASSEVSFDHSLLSNLDLSNQHPMSSITGLVDALNSKSGGDHGHSISQVSDLTNQLSAKASASHTHPISEVVNLQDNLNGKLSSAAGAVGSGNLASGAVIKAKLGSDVPQVLSGTSATPPSGTYPAGTLYIQY